MTVPQLAKALAAADEDWRAGTSERDISRTGRLAKIFQDGGWGYSVGLDSAGRVLDWCGIAVGAWLYRAGLRPEHRKSFFQTTNVRGFFAYNTSLETRRRMVLQLDGRPIRDVHAAAGALRSWTETAELRARPLAAWDVKPGDVLLIAHDGRTTSADHIAMVTAFDARSGRLETIEGNARGFDASGRDTRDAVVRKARDLSSVAVRNTIYGVGRLSRLDFA